MHQYWRPGGEQFVGDCMPFFHEDVLHLYYLLDEQHHKARGGLGCHQWAHASTTDLVHWEHHPLALPIEHDWEGSICTGSIFWHEGLCYAFYATRRPDRDQHLCVATSADGIHFTKSPSNPFASPQVGYSPKDYRDPVVFRDEATGLFHLLASASLTDHALPDRGGCLAHLVSPDLQQWELQEPFLIPGYVGVPECPDVFAWNGWHYLIFSNWGVARYRMSRSPLGPWLAPPVDTFDGPLASVMKTAAFGPNRRLGAAFLPSLEGDRDDGARLYAGNVVFREIIQEQDGTLWSGFVPEMTPVTGAAVRPGVAPISGHCEVTDGAVTLREEEGLAVAALSPVPVEARVTARLTPLQPPAACGIAVRGEGAFTSGYQIRLSPQLRRVEICRANAGPVPEPSRNALLGADGLDQPVLLEVICHEDIVDVCINRRRCLVTRLPELRGDTFFVFCQNGSVRVEGLEIVSGRAQAGQDTGRE